VVRPNQVFKNSVIPFTMQLVVYCTSVGSGRSAERPSTDGWLEAESYVVESSSTGLQLHKRQQKCVFAKLEQQIQTRAERDK